MAKAKIREISSNERRHHIRTLIQKGGSVFDSLKAACGSVWNESSPKTVTKHLSQALSYAEGLSCGVVWTESLPEISKLIRGKDENAITEAIAESMDEWLSLFEATHDLSEVGGWTDFQISRCETAVEWFGKYLASVVSPVTKNGKTKKRKGKKGKKASKASVEPSTDSTEDRLTKIEVMLEALLSK